MNVELVAQMFKNYQSNVLFHLEGAFQFNPAHDSYADLNSDGEPEGARVLVSLI